jgi:hypothetical protein
MAITNQERVGKAMELLRQGLAAYAAREFKSLHKAQADSEALRHTKTIATCRARRSRRGMAAAAHRGFEDRRVKLGCVQPAVTKLAEDRAESSIR